MVTIAAFAAAPASISIVSEKNELRVGVGYTDDTCYPAGDSFSGVSYTWLGPDQHAFETCYVDMSNTLGTRCWSHSFYYIWWLLLPPRKTTLDGWYPCAPNGKDWVAVDPLADCGCSNSR